MEIYCEDLEKESLYDLNKDLIFIEDIDEGAFGKVIHAKEKSTQRDIAVKIMDKRQASPDLIKKMKEEISILKKLSHKNIVKFYGQIETSNQFLIKMEYIKYGNLSQWMKKHKKISEEEASIILKQVLSAVAYLHNNQICHRDIKPDNIMLSKEDDLNSIKIVDFGLSTQYFDSLFNSDYCGTIIYMAPEEIERKSYFLSVDLWSIGILMYMLLNKNEHPFYHEGETEEDFINKIKTFKELKCNNKISYMAMNLMKKLLEPDPIKRYKADDALKHPWITRNVKDKIPQTFNELLNNDNIINNARELMMISIFLNYFKKNNVFSYGKTNDNNSNLEKIIDGIELKKKKELTGIYKISDNYIKKCEIISKAEKERLKELKEKYLDVSSTEEESDDKNNNNSNSNSKMNTLSNINSHKKSNFNISSDKNCSKNSRNEDKLKKFSEESNSIKEKPMILLELKDFNNINNKNHINYTENKRVSLRLNTMTGLILNKIKNESHFNHMKRTGSKKRQYSNIVRNITNLNINNNMNVYNYSNKNINKIKPVNLFLNNYNNISKKKEKIYENKISRTNTYNNKNKNSGKANNLSKPLKLPKINYNVGQTNYKCKNSQRLLSLIK